MYLIFFFYIYNLIYNLQFIIYNLIFNLLLFGSYLIRFIYYYITMEVATNSLCFLINSSWLLVFIFIFFFLLFFLFNLYYWNYIYFLFLLIYYPFIGAAIICYLNKFPFSLYFIFVYTYK